MPNYWASVREQSKFGELNWYCIALWPTGNFALLTGEVIWNEAATSEITCTINEELVDFQDFIHIMYITSCIPSETEQFKLPFDLQFRQGQKSVLKFLKSLVVEIKANEGRTVRGLVI